MDQLIDHGHGIYTVRRERPKEADLVGIPMSERIGGYTMAQHHRSRGSDSSAFERAIGGIPGGSITHYATYPEDVPRPDEHGRVTFDCNGNVIYDHRKGDRVLDDNGQPIIIPSTVDYIYHGRRKGFPNGCGDEIEFRIKEKPVDEQKILVDAIAYLSPEKFDVVFRKVAEEKMRRVAGGEPLDPTMVTASL
jgi:hypothetical protein